MECEHKNSLNNFIEHYLKSVTLEETKESFKRMLHHRSKSIKLVESRYKSKHKGRKLQRICIGEDTQDQLD